jgi:ribosomal protein L20
MIFCLRMLLMSQTECSSKRKDFILQASGYRGAHSVLFRVANQQVRSLCLFICRTKTEKRIFRRIGLVESMQLLD